jgi:hypothetical protein
MRVPPAARRVIRPTRPHTIKVLDLEVIHHAI